MLNTHSYATKDISEYTESGNTVKNHRTFDNWYTYGNTIDFHSFIQDKFLCHLNLINDFRTYLDKDDLKICYQPLVDLESGKTVSVEALIRWQHKLAGYISPEIFIPIVEQTDHIHALTYWMLNHTLQQIYEWNLEGINLDVAVNLSMFNLHDEAFPGQVSRLLDKWAINPEKLILEITEGVIMYDPEKTIHVLNQLKNSGVRLALDDFGAGYSSLSHLSKLPISELKIDRSLITDINSNAKNATIVRSTIELARKLGINVVAEGVEDKNTCNILGSYGCDFAQGYYFSKPMNTHDFKSWFKGKPGIFVTALPA